MARLRQPLLKRCKTLGINPSVMGYNKAISSESSKDNVRKKKSEYGMQLSEKQKVKFIYGVLERQFHKYYVMASKREGVTGEMLLQILESRLDNVIYRLGFAKTRDAAKQLVSHAHVAVNGKKVTVSSYLVKAGDIISFKAKSLENNNLKDMILKNTTRTVPAWLEMNKDALTGKVVTLSTRGDIDYAVKEQLIVEFYSR